MNSKNRMYVLMLLVPLFWGGSFATAEHVITEISPLVVATVIAVVFLWSSHYKVANFWNDHCISRRLYCDSANESKKESVFV